LPVSLFLSVILRLKYDKLVMRNKGPELLNQLILLPSKVCCG